MIPFFSRTVRLAVLGLFLLAPAARLMGAVAVLPFRVQGKPPATAHYGHATLRPGESSREDYFWSRELAKTVGYFLATEKAVTLRLGDEVETKPDQPPVGSGKVSIRTLNRKCRQREADHLVLGDIFFGGSAWLERLFYFSCGSGQLLFQSGHNLPPDRWLTQHYDFLRRFFHFLENRPGKEETGSTIRGGPDAWFLLSASSRTATDFETAANYILDYSRSLSPGQNTPGIIAISPRGNHLILRPERNFSQVERFFEKIQRGGVFQGDLPLLRALRVYDRKTGGTGARLAVFTNEIPGSWRGRARVEQAVGRLRGRGHQISFLAGMGSTPRELAWYRKLSRLGGGEFSPVAYGFPIFFRKGGSNFFTLHGDRFYISREPVFDRLERDQIAAGLSSGQIRIFSQELHPDQPVHPSLARSLLKKQQGGLIHEFGPVKSNLDSILGGILDDKNPRKATTERRFLVQTDDGTLWVSASGPNTRLLNQAAHQGGVLTLGLRIQPEFRSGQGFGNIPGRLEVVQRRDPRYNLVSRLLMATGKDLRSRMEYYSNQGFGRPPVWFVRGQIKAVAGSRAGDIRD